MHKNKSRSRQRGAIVRDREYISREDFYNGTKIELTEIEVKNFHFGSNDVASFLKWIEPKVRSYAKGGFRKPAEVSRLLNKEGVQTACGRSWTPRLAWFLLRLMFHSDGGASRRPSSNSKQNAGPSKPKLVRIWKRVVKDNPRSIESMINPRQGSLTSEETAKRLSLIGRVTRLARP